MNNEETRLFNDKTNKLNKLFNNELLEKLEKGIYDFSYEYSKTNEIEYLIESIYNTKVDEILDGLTNNPDIIKYYKTEYKKNKEEALKKIYELAFSSSEIINPNKYDKIIKKEQIKEYKKNDIKSSNAFTCSKCKKAKCDVTQRQSRSGDEPATISVRCLECGHTFTFN